MQASGAGWGWSFRVSFIIAAVLLGASQARAQLPAPNPAPVPLIPDTPSTLAFEVASVKPSGPLPQGGFSVQFGLQNGRFTIPQATLISLIGIAYGVRPYQMIGGPSWVRTDRFDINAKAEADGQPPAPTPPGTPNRMQLLVQSLLRERFGLVVHRETRELPIATLVVARKDGRLGERLKPSTVDCQALMAERRRAGTPPEPPKPGETPPCFSRGGIGSVMGRAAPLGMIVSLLSGQLDRPVFDRTNLTGVFDFDLEFTPDRMPTIPPGATLPPGLTLPSPDGPSLMTALQEQLGLKVELGKGPVDVLVIDSATPPTPD